MKKEELLIPKKYATQFEKILKGIWKLPDELWEKFWFSILIDMEDALEDLELEAFQDEK